MRKVYMGSGKLSPGAGRPGDCVAQASKSAVPRVSKPAGGSAEETAFKEPERDERDERDTARPAAPETGMGHRLTQIDTDMGKSSRKCAILTDCIAWDEWHRRFPPIGWGSLAPCATFCGCSLLRSHSGSRRLGGSLQPPQVVHCAKEPSIYWRINLVPCVPCVPFVLFVPSGFLGSLTLPLRRQGQFRPKLRLIKAN
jgi:hypothetical protein